jgi:hypothetical protein
VTNTTKVTRDAIIYGPPFDRIRHIYPAQILRPTAVAVHLPHRVVTYVGLTVLGIRAQGRTYLLLRFLPGARPQSIAIADSNTVRADDLHAIDNPSCVIKKLR